MKVKIKKLDANAVIPVKAKANDAGLDLTSISVEKGLSYIEYGTGLAFEIPEGHVGYLFPRSSISKTSLSLANSVGVIDSGYRGEVKLRFKRPRQLGPIYEVGDRIGQLIIMPIPNIELEEVKDLSKSHRGDEGFGSSGR